MKILDSTVPKFILVGLANTAVGAGIMFLLYNVAGLSYWISSCCNYIAGGIVSYFLNKFFTFRNSEKSLRQVLIFIANLAVCYFIAYFLAKKAVQLAFSSRSVKFRDNVAMLCGMCLYTVLNYLGQRFLVFRKASDGDTSQN